MIGSLTNVVKEKGRCSYSKTEKFMEGESFDINDRFLGYDENLGTEEAFQYFISKDFNDRIIKEVDLEEDFLYSNRYKC